jgi:hypothetical protein
MNDSEIEDQLRLLKPAAPSEGLAARIEQELAIKAPSNPTAGVIVRPSKPSVFWKWVRDLGWAGAGAATALGAVALYSAVQRPAVQKAMSPTAVAATPDRDRAKVAGAAPVAATAEEQAFEPTEASRELVAVNDSNELLDTENGPVREVRYTYLERLAWAHPGTGARIEIEVPREDVYLLPVSLQ